MSETSESSTSDLSRTAGGSRLGNALVGIGLGLSLAAIGLLFCWALWRGYRKANETRDWTPVDAEIVRSVVKETRPVPGAAISYEHDLAYRYQLAGESREGNRIKRVEGGSRSRARIEERVEAYQLGQTVTAYANPEAPDEVVLEHSTLAPLYTIWFPGLFVVGGIGIAASSVYRGVASGEKAKSPS